MVLLLAGCLADRENTVSRTARMREIQAAQELRERQQREIDLLRQTEADAEARIPAVNVRVTESAYELRAVMADLDHRLDRLRRAEGDLQAAQQRGQEIERQLAPLRALEQQLAELEQARTAATARAEVLGKEVAAAEQLLAQQQATLGPRLDKLKAQLAAVQSASQAIAQAEAAVSAAQAALAPPPIQPPPTQPPAKK